MRLLEPLALGSVVAPNRLLFGPHVTNLGWDRSLSERHLAYYERRARGGAGTIVVEEASVHDSDWPYERCPLAQACGPGWRRLAEAGHRHGAVVLAALGHSGGQGSSAYNQSALWAPSGVPEVITREMPKVMEAGDIATVVAGFGEAAALAAASGLDGVEVNAGQHALVRQFLSGLTNQRADGHGADRLRFAREVLEATRAGLGRGPVLGLRLSCDELAPWAGITPEAAEAFAAELAPLVDYLVVVRGAIFSVSATRPDLHDPPGFNLELCGRIRAAVRAAVGDRVAVVAQGSIVEPGQAEQALLHGVADAVEMTRAQIADPDLGRKVARGATDRVRPCLLCNQRCQVRDNRNPLVSCVVEPRSGYECQDPEPVGGDAWSATGPGAPPAVAAAHPTAAGIPAAVAEAHPTAVAAAGVPAAGRPVAGRPVARGTVLVVGGGPAGLECARMAASAGHAVTVVEARAEPGGWARLAARLGGRERLSRVTSWLEAECRRLGVVIRCGHRASPAEVASHPGPVVICSGGRDRTPDYEVAADAALLTVAAWLDAEGGGDRGGSGGGGDLGGVGGGGDLGRGGVERNAGHAAREGAGAVGDDGPVTVWDPVGGPVGVATAEELAATGRPTTLASPDFVIGTLLALSGDLAPANVRLQQAGVRLLRRVVLRRVEAGRAIFEDRVTAQRIDVESTLVVDCGHRWPDDTPWPERLTRAGDAVAPRSIHEAILEGRRAALALPPAPAPTLLSAVPAPGSSVEP